MAAPTAPMLLMLECWARMSSTPNNIVAIAFMTVCAGRLWPSVSSCIAFFAKKLPAPHVVARLQGFKDFHAFSVFSGVRAAVFLVFLTLPQALKPSSLSSCQACQHSSSQLPNSPSPTLEFLLPRFSPCILHTLGFLLSCSLAPRRSHNLTVSESQSHNAAIIAQSQCDIKTSDVCQSGNLVIYQAVNCVSRSIFSFRPFLSSVRISDIIENMRNTRTRSACLQSR